MRSSTGSIKLSKSKGKGNKVQYDELKEKLIKNYNLNLGRPAKTSQNEERPKVLIGTTKAKMFNSNLKEPNKKLFNKNGSESDILMQLLKLHKKK